MAYEMGDPEIAAVTKVIRGKFLFRYGWPGSGWTRQVETLEKSFARFIGTKYAVATTSGTASLMTALASTGVGLGDEVIVPAYTFMATPLSVVAVGAIPVIADIDEGMGLDPEEVTRKITSRTRAIIPVHMMGLIANLGPILEIARKKNILVIEDCAQATGGSWRGRRCGSWGAAGAFSHNHYKTISAGEGGTVTLKDRKHFERAMLYQDAGAYFFDPRMRKLHVPYFAGGNFRMSELLGAMLNAQMKRLPGLLKVMNAHKRRMYKALAHHPLCPCAPVHDLAGDCGKALFLRLPESGLSTTFADRLGAAGVSTQSWFRDLNSDRHIYQNWWPILTKQGHIDPRQNPYKTTEAGRRIKYSRDMAPRCLDLLARTVAVSINPRWTNAKVDRVVETVDRVARTL
ncbi:MAG: DegT/DnrJ/EryC1/StrS family aminotransferase [Candidatus Coatesbacteria bacterium]